MDLFDKNKSLPIYVQAAQWIREKVTSGEWPRGYKLAPEIELAKELQISRGTLRKAMELLIKEKTINQVHGKGTFVSTTKPEQSWSYRLTTNSEELMLQGQQFHTEILDFRRCLIKDPKVAGILRLAPGVDEVFFLKRLQIISDIPAVLQESFFPADLHPAILNESKTQALNPEMLDKLLDMDVSRAEHTISAMYSDAPIANLLKINYTEPVIYDEHTFFDDNDRVVEFTKRWFKGDRFKLKTIVFR